MIDFCFGKLFELFLLLQTTKKFNAFSNDFGLDDDDDDEFLKGADDIDDGDEDEPSDFDDDEDPDKIEVPGKVFIPTACYFLSKLI